MSADSLPGVASRYGQIKIAETLTLFIGMRLWTEVGRWTPLRWRSLAGPYFVDTPTDSLFILLTALLRSAQVLARSLVKLGPSAP